MVFASRKSRDFITPQQVDEVEKWAGKVCSPFEVRQHCLASFATESMLSCSFANLFREFSTLLSTPKSLKM